MATIARRLRDLVDGVNKQKAQRIPTPTGGDGRNTEEVLGTSAAAKGMAMLRNRKSGPDKPLSLQELIAKQRNQLFR